MEKPKGASMSAIYQDTYPAWEKYPIMNHFNRHDPEFRGLGSMRRVIPNGLENGADQAASPKKNSLSGVKRGAEQASLSTSPSSLVSPIKARLDIDVSPLADGVVHPPSTLATNAVLEEAEEGEMIVAKTLSPTTFSYADRMKNPLADLSFKVVDIPVSPKGHFSAALAYLTQPETRATGYANRHMSLTEAHQAIGRDMKVAFEAFAATFTCPTCTPDIMSKEETARQLSILKQKLADIGHDGNVFLNGGVASDGRLVKSRVEIMQATLKHIEGELQGMGRRGEHVTHETVIRTAIAC